MLRIWTLVLFLGALLGGVGPARAASAEATDAAFGALLSMPGTKPVQGKWIIPDKYAAAFDDQSELIECLKELKKQGADFNAMRHRGTLLAHAIRAELLDQTALWLLRNGAAPKPVLFNDETTTAYDLARKYERPVVAKVLENEHGFSAPKPRSAKTQSLVAPKMAIPKSKVEEGVALLDALMTTPYPDKAKQEAWQRFASKLSDAEFASLFKDGAYIESLVRLSREIDGAVEKAFSRLPIAVVRQHAQLIANLLAERSEVSYRDNGAVSYSPASHAWPALWQRVEQALRYDSRPDLAERIPPKLWPALFASGYAEQDAALTGCLLASVDLAAFKALWPDFLRFFSNAREEAPALVLSKYRSSFDPQVCGYSSSPAQTIEKLSFLRQQGVQAKVGGISKRRLSEAVDPALTAAVERWLRKTLPPPQLVEVAPRCELALSEAWLDKLIKTPIIGWGIPAEFVQIIEVPGYAHCGLIIGGSFYSAHAEISDSVEGGPSREAWPSCPDSPEDSEIWIEGADGIFLAKTSFDTRGESFAGQVKDVQSGKTYLLRSGIYQGTMCSPFWSLPQPYEWQDGVLHPARETRQIARVLSTQCEELAEDRGFKCRGFSETSDSEADPPQGAAVFTALRKGQGVSVLSLIDALGAERRRAYAAAVATRDHAAHRALVAAGIPPHWTVAEIIALGKSDLPLEQKRRRIALLFSNETQLTAALNNQRYDVPEALLSWLPRQDWGPVWRVIRQQPDFWWNAAGSLSTLASKAGRQDLLCDIDRAQGFLCGGGIELE